MLTLELEQVGVRGGSAVRVDPGDLVLQPCPEGLHRGVVVRVAGRAERQLDAGVWFKVWFGAFDLLAACESEHPLRSPFGTSRACHVSPYRPRRRPIGCSSHVIVRQSVSAGALVSSDRTEGLA